MMQITRLSNKYQIIIGSLLLIALWAVWCLFFLNKGIDLTDEGLFCSEVWRFAQGDIPFRDSTAAFGLSFWWLSWVINIFPDCTLLDLRITWAIVTLLCAIITANLMLRFFNPIISFAGMAVSLFVATSGVIKILSYNSMPVIFLLLTAWLWLLACNKRGYPQLLLAAAAGILAFLATTCRLSLLPVVLLPLSTIIYDLCCRVKMHHRLPAIATFIIAYLAGLLIFFIVINSMGLTSEFIQTFTITFGIQGHSMQNMVINFLFSSFYYLFPTVIFLIVLIILHFKHVLAFSRQHKKALLYILIGILVIIIAIIIWDVLSTHSILGFLLNGIQSVFITYFTVGTLNLFFISLAIGVTLSAVIRHIFSSDIDRQTDKIHQIYRLGIMAVLLALLMIPGTGNVPASSVKYMAWLPISLSICLLWLWIPKHVEYPAKSYRSWSLKGLLIVLIIFCALQGIYANHTPYRERPVNELVVTPETTKLQGIFTTSERASIIDQLVSSIELHSQPGDRILAYENIPMLYYLSERLPSTNLTWITESYPLPIREFVLEDMLQRDRIPQLIIRTIYTTRNADWPTSKYPLQWKNNEPDTDPINKYVNDNYQVIQEINGIQILAPDN